MMKFKTSLEQIEVFADLRLVCAAMPHLEYPSVTAYAVPPSLSEKAFVILQFHQILFSLLLFGLSLYKPLFSLIFFKKQNCLL